MLASRVRRENFAHGYYVALGSAFGFQPREYIHEVNRVTQRDFARLPKSLEIPPVDIGG